MAYIATWFVDVWLVYASPRRTTTSSPPERVDGGYFPPIKGESRPVSIEQVLDIGHVPASATGGTDAVIVECGGQSTQIANARRAKRLDDREDVGSEGIGVATYV